MFRFVNLFLIPKSVVKSQTPRMDLSPNTGHAIPLKD